MSKLRQWSVFTALAVLLVLAAGYFLLVSPKRSQAAELRDQAATQQQANATLRVQLAQLKAQAAKLTEQQARLSVIAGEIPDNPALPALIRSLSDAADAANVDLVSIAPGQPTLAKTATPLSQPAAASGLAVVPVTVGITGGYADITLFMGGLEDLPRSFLVSGLSVTPGAAMSGAAGTSAPGTSALGTSAVGTSTLGHPLTVSITGRVFMATTAPTTSPTAPSSPAAAPATR